MMWIRGEDGRLHNLADARTVQLMPAATGNVTNQMQHTQTNKGHFIVQVTYPEGTTVDLIFPRNEDEARLVLEDIAKGMRQRADYDFIDLSLHPGNEPEDLAQFNSVNANSIVE